MESPTSEHGKSAAGRLGSAIPTLVRIVACLAILGFGAGTYEWLRRTRPVMRGSDEPEIGLPVIVFEPTPVAVHRQWTGYGTTRAMDSAAVPARVAAVVVERPDRIQAGAPIRAGEVIVRLDESDFRRQADALGASIAELEAQMDRLEIEAAAWAERSRLAEEDVRLAQADLERVRRAAESAAAQVREVEAAQQRLFTVQRQQVAAREELDKVPSRRAGLAAQREGLLAQKHLSELSIARCTITSPIDGVIAEVDVERGESVAPGQRVARVVGLGRIEVGLRLPASARPDLAVGDQVLLFEEGREADRSSRTWSATIDRIAPDDDPAGRTITVFAEVTQQPDAPDLLPSGRFVQGLAISSQAVPRLVLPRRAVRSDRIWVVRDGRLERVEVTPHFTLRAPFPELGLPDLDWVALRGSLPPGELVVVDGSRFFTPGSRVVPMPSEPGATPMEQVSTTPDSRLEKGLGRRPDSATPSSAPAEPIP